MKIVTQTNEQECGVCALTALHNHYYKEFISKEQALEQSHISNDGMTIFDFESLAVKVGLECESYEVTYSEFKNLKINSYFVLLLSTGGSSNHYVVARKKKEYIEIYDSSSLKMGKLKYSELQKVFLNLIILVKKRKGKAFGKLFSKASTLLMFDLKFVLLNVGLSILILITSVVSASFLNYIIDLAISKSSINNLITIAFIFTLMYFANDLLTYISNLYMSKQIKNYFVLFTSKILSSLENKKLDFLDKVDKNWIFKIDECVYNISNFTIVEINRFITSIIFCSVCICIIGIIQYYLLIFVLVYAIIEFIFFLFSYRKKKEVFLNIVRSENNNAQYYKNLIFSLKNEIWLSKRKTIISQIKNNYSNIYKNYSDVILFKSNTTVLKSIFKSLCEICVISLMSYLIIKNENLSVGKLTFVVSAFALYKNSLSDLFGYFISKLEFDVYWQVYKDLTSVSNNITHKTHILKDEIKTISFKYENKLITLSTHKQFENINYSILFLFKNVKKILLNDVAIKLDKDHMNNIIVFDQQSTSSIEYLIKLVEKEPVFYSQYIRYFDLDLNRQQFNFYENLIINFIVLLSEKDKIIFIDDVFKYIKKKDKVVIKQILNKIKKHNTVFVTGKEEND